MNWSDRSAFELQLSDALRPKVAVWNEVFDMPYHLFRHQVKEIARACLAQVQRVTRVTDWDEIPNGALVAPVDDDDWFAPDFATVLERALAPGVSACTWTSRFIERPINLGHRLGLLLRRIHPARRPRFICTTNNYVMRKGLDYGRHDVFRSHVQASAWVMERPRDSVPRLPLQLSVMNRTLGSQTSLAWDRPRIERAELLRKYQQYAKLYDRAPLDGIEWCRPHVARMAKLMRELTLKPR